MRRDTNSMSRTDYTGASGLVELRSRLEEDEEEELACPAPGGPFSALLPSMLPGDLATVRQQEEEEDPHGQQDYRWDEFGYRVEEEDGPEDCSSKLLSIPFQESPRRKLEWSVELQLGQGKQTLLRNGKFERLLWEGIPHSLRASIWPLLLASDKKKEDAGVKYRDIVASCSGGESLHSSRQIEKDLLRTMPTNICFSQKDSVGIPRLRRVLRAIAWIFPDIGYCQGMGMIAASLLLFCPEEESFWMMASIIENLLPVSYFSSNLWGAQADQLVLRSLIAQLLPEVDSVLSKHDIEISLISLHWFLTLFASCLHIKVVVRVWDLLFHYGTIVLFKVAIAMLSLSQESLLTATNSAEIFNLLSALPSKVDDVEALIGSVHSMPEDKISKAKIEELRRVHLSTIMADQSSFALYMDNTRPVPRPWTSKRRPSRSRSIVDLLMGSEPEQGNDPRCKNIKRTEQLVYLREAILRIGTFFQGLDPVYQTVSLQPDYSLDSHARDLENYMKTYINKRKRARAIIDFERKDDDELGFRRNDIITVLSQQDEHCWVGELNGLVGWFPAKFVQMIDERSRPYSYAGDDRVNQAITDIVRGSLCSAMKQILDQGLKRAFILGGPVHPWQFIQEAAGEEVSRDYNSVFSKLVLCKTFRLDEDEKVLSPEELLYRCVHYINQTHDKFHAQMDVKLRSLICLGLNEQVLHLWLECLCSAEKSLAKFYSDHSILSSPGWVLVKCELRTLAQFSFHLSPNWELPGSADEFVPLKEGVKDMLVKHHLFSWDL